MKSSIKLPNSIEWGNLIDPLINFKILTVVLGFANWDEIISKNLLIQNIIRKKVSPLLLPLIKCWVNVKSVTNKKSN